MTQCISEEDLEGTEPTSRTLEMTGATTLSALTAGAALVFSALY